MQTPFGRPHGWPTLALLLAAWAAAPRAGAQTAAAPGYDGFTQTAFVPFHGPNAVHIQVGGRPFSVTMDLGSTGLAITADSIPGYSAEMAAQQWRFSSESKEAGVRTVVLTFLFRLTLRCTDPATSTSVFYPPYKFEVRSEMAPLTCDDCSAAELEKMRCRNPRILSSESAR